MTATEITAEIKAQYGSVAASLLTGSDPGVSAVAEAFGYTPEELATIPTAAHMGLSCGNPTATANLRPGEVVVDLGCGGGIDVIFAARKVGPTGKAIGIDMTPQMIYRAKTNAATLAAKGEALPVEFYLAEMEHMPLTAGSVDCIISNCVINLATDKPAAIREMYRVLKVGGRLAISDIAMKQPLPDDVAQTAAAYIGCISGALTLADYERFLKDAGFTGVQVIDTKKDLNAYGLVEGQSGCCSPEMPATPGSLSLSTITEGEWIDASQGCCGATSAVHAGLGEVLTHYDLNEYAASVQVFAIKS